MDIKSVQTIFLALLYLAIHSSSFAQAKEELPIIMSSRWFHPRDDKDTLSTLKMIKDFHPDRIDWMYCSNTKQLEEIRKLGVPYSLAINPQIPDSAGYTVQGRIEDLNGQKVVAPWMKSWNQKNPYWGCVNSPEFQKLFLAKSKEIVDLKAYGIFVDDARFNDHAFEWGGCFCDHCISGFNKYLVNEVKKDSIDPSFNYKDYRLSRSKNTSNAKNARDPYAKLFKDFQQSSVVRFLTKWKADLKAYAGNDFVFLTNNPNGSWNKIYEIFDSGICEISANNRSYESLERISKQAKAKNKTQVLSIATSDSTTFKRLSVYSYSLGNPVLLPWDLMLQPTSERSEARRIYFDGKNWIDHSMLLRSLYKTSTLKPSVSAGKRELCGDARVLTFAKDGKKVTVFLPDLRDKKPKCNIGNVGRRIHLSELSEISNNARLKSASRSKVSFQNDADIDIYLE
ncbi:hypothetical protein [Dyadobacter sp. CY351]|uniref:hypothetical protein n=1 Tax=Dyadobacter sp. CY351 TaxID=2909337 RepID=UPI001F2D4923|nr:hypothetical protein [Dyadobacter sp. CY351]MCF2518427.1 hypothetical protein [Dyadobacter sp. CY351]